jgi:hypothetical protein
MIGEGVDYPDQSDEKQELQRVLALEENFPKCQRQGVDLAGTIVALDR